MFRALFARLRPERTPPPIPLPPGYDQVLERLSGLEQTVAEFHLTHEAAAARELSWNDMNAQLRRYLGRLDAHAGLDRAEQRRADPRAERVAEVLRLKFPNGIPTHG